MDDSTTPGKHVLSSFMRKVLEEDHGSALHITPKDLDLSHINSLVVIRRFDFEVKRVETYYGVLKSFGVEVEVMDMDFGADLGFMIGLYEDEDENYKKSFERNLEVFEHHMAYLDGVKDKIRLNSNNMTVLIYKDGLTTSPILKRGWPDY